MKVAKHTEKELVHILWCLMCADNGGEEATVRILQYLNDCPCKHCREGKGTFEWWLKEIRNPESFWRMKEINK